MQLSLPDPRTGGIPSPTFNEFGSIDLPKVSDRLWDSAAARICEQRKRVFRGIGLASGMLAKSVLNAAWGQLISFTDYKAAEAGGLVAKVNPRGTSQECDCCGRVTPKTLSERIHDCPRCGTVEDRDVHAAKVIKHRAFPWTKRAGAALEASSQRGAA